MTKKLKYASAIFAILTISLGAMNAKADNDNNGKDDNGKNNFPAGITKQIQALDINKLLSNIKISDDDLKSKPASLTINPNGEFKLNGGVVVTIPATGNPSFTVKSWGITFTVNYSTLTNLRVQNGAMLITELHVGDIVNIQGKIDANGVVLATRVENLSIASSEQNVQLRNQINALIERLNLLLGKAGLPPVATPTTTQAMVVPPLATVSPASTTFGSAGLTLTLTGTNFTSASVAKWAGTALTTTFVSATQLNAAIPAANVATTTNVLITVFNPGTYGGTSNALPFSVQ